MNLTLKQQTIDWKGKKHVSGKDLQRSVVKKKFAMWDYVMANNILSHKDERTRNKAIMLLDDPTIYEYAFFENDDGNPFEYEAYQDLIAQCKYNFEDIDDPNRFVLFVASNQIGKSRLEIGLARYFLFTAKGENIVIVTNNLKLTQFILSELKANLNTGKFADSWKEDIDEINNTTMLTVKLIIDGKEYTNRIICTPAGEGSLGYPIHRLFLDELDFYDEGKRLFWKVFFPRLNKTKGQIFGLSNPNPDIPLSASILKELWDGDLFERKFHFNFLDASWNTKSDFEKARRNSPAHYFASTHLGQWSEDSGSFLTQREIDDMMNREWSNKTLPFTSKPVYIGMDLGKMRDNTVFSIGTVTEPSHPDDKYKDLDVLYQEELPLGTTYEAIVDRYKAIMEFYSEQGAGVVAMGYDATGQKTFEDLLNIKGVPGIPVDFASKKSNKTLLFNDFKLMAENRKIRVAYSPKCEKQLANLQYKLTDSKKYKKVENKSDTIHDDYCFVSGTLVLTDKGQIPIEQLSNGDMVMTRKGYRRITATGCRLEKVISKLGLTGTEDHPFITNKGITKFKYLNQSHNIYIWNEKQSSIEERHIIGILNHRGDKIGCTIGATTNGKNHRKRYTEKYGKTIMEKFQKDMSSTTKTEILSTTQSPISNVCQEDNINQITVVQKKESKHQEKHSQNMLDQKQSNGISQKKDGNGMTNIMQSHLEKLRSTNTHVNVVEKHILAHEKQKQDFAHTNVATILETKQKVYNITVEGENEYFANNILVHNCDSLAILIHIAVKPSSYPASAVIVGARKRKEEEEKPLTTHEAAEKYYAQVIQQNNSFNRQGNQGGIRRW